MKNEDSSVCLERKLSPPARMDDVVVENQMNSPCAPVCPAQFPQQINEQEAAFLLAFNPTDLTRMGIQGSCDEIALVVTRRDDFLLLPWQHPVATDLRVEVDVDFVDVEYHLIRPLRLDEPPDRSLSSSPFFGRDTGSDHGSRLTPADLEPLESPVERPLADLHSSVLDKHSSQQFTSPGGSQVTEVLRRLSDNLNQGLFEIDIDLLETVVSASILERVKPACLEAPCDPDRRGRGTANLLGDPVAPKSLVVKENDAAAVADIPIGALALDRLDLPLYTPVKTDYYPLHQNSSCHFFSFLLCDGRFFIATELADQGGSFQIIIRDDGDGTYNHPESRPPI